MSINMVAAVTTPLSPRGSYIPHPWLVQKGLSMVVVVTTPYLRSSDGCPLYRKVYRWFVTVTMSLSVERYIDGL